MKIYHTCSKFLHIIRIIYSYLIIFFNQTVVQDRDAMYIICYRFFYLSVIFFLSKGSTFWRKLITIYSVVSLICKMEASIRYYVTALTFQYILDPLPFYHNIYRTVQQTFSKETNETMTQLLLCILLFAMLFSRTYSYLEIVKL